MVGVAETLLSQEKDKTHSLYFLIRLAMVNQQEEITMEIWQTLYWDDKVLQISAADLNDEI